MKIIQILKILKKSILTFIKKNRITILDVGCGFGGLLSIYFYNIVTLSPEFPNDCILGLEIRHKVTQYVIDRINNLRDTNIETNGVFYNINSIKIYLLLKLMQ